MNYQRSIPWCSLPVILFATLLTRSARAEPSTAHPDRKGFTLELGLGMSFTSVSTTLAPTNANAVGVVSSPPSRLATKSYADLGVAPLSLSLGWFLTRDLALQARLSGTSFFPTADSSDHKFVQVVNAFYGLAAQYWISDDFFLGAGVGLARYATNPALSTTDSFDLAGIAFVARAGYSIVTTKHDSLAVVVELLPALYHHDWSDAGQTHQDTSILGTSIGLQWQYY